MYIISGEKKGRQLFGPGPEEIRPITHLVRKAIFDLLRQVIDGAEFLDLFAGTGSVGLEALSQGAKSCFFVDRLPEAIELISKNVEELNYSDRTRICRSEASDALERLGALGHRFDIVFVGPPYETDLAEKTLRQLDELQVVNPGGLIVVEVFLKEDLKDRLKSLRQIKNREYGQTKLLIYRKLGKA